MVPRKVGTDWEVRAPAKLNLYLEVLGRRSDGFHELETLMLPVHFYDNLHWSPCSAGQPGCSLTIRDQLDRRGATLSSTDNLILRAAGLLAARAGIRPHGRFQLVKRIPLQAGLGGGSSNAAATLRLANAAWQAGLSDAELTDLARELGSDVPFFIHTAPAVCRGRGERVEAIGQLPRLELVMVKPPRGMSTPEVFRELGESEAPNQLRRDQSALRLNDLVAALRSGAVARACQYMTNRLEAVAARLAPEISRIKSALASAGCWGQFMTGSGSTVVGVARSAVHARRVARQLSAQNFGTVLAVASGW